MTTLCPLSTLPPQTGAVLDIESAAREACGWVAPLWPLDQFVAVNPYLGLADLPFDEACVLLSKTAGTASVMPLAFYLQAWEEGRFSQDDLAGVLATRGELSASWPEALLSEARRLSQMEEPPRLIPTVADVAAELSGVDWPRLVVDWVSTWAGHYTDTGQVGWASVNQQASPYASWRESALLDRSPDIAGLKGFRQWLAQGPATALGPRGALATAVEDLGIPVAVLPLYGHRLLMTTPGWSSAFRQRGWQASLEGRANESLNDLLELLTIRLAYEAALLSLVPHPSLLHSWQQALSTAQTLSRQNPPSRHQQITFALQAALERGERRRLLQTVLHNIPVEGANRPQLQAVFCIDVRSEVFRRHLESLSPEIETLGFAGFFGMPLRHFQPGDAVGTSHCPVLLSPRLATREEAVSAEARELQARQMAEAKSLKQSWFSFKSNPVSCFGFVGPLGLGYLPQLLGKAFGAKSQGLFSGRWRSRSTAGGADGGRLAADLSLATRIDLAEGALRGMSLTAEFGRVVLLVAHTASSENNPHHAGLACGACGGQSGEPNARLAADLMNDPEVRYGLAGRGIEIPQDTRFVAAVHNTTTDQVEMLVSCEELAFEGGLWQRVEGWLRAATQMTLRERADRLPGVLRTKPGLARRVQSRGMDWAELRPEWGLAGCNALIIGRRSLTRGLDLKGSAFLHSYDWRQDPESKTLEMIMTAPLVVASWISLQYYASTTDPEVMGAGNKTLHNIVGRMGVMEGAGGDLRCGLPWQSVHDGESLQHLPVKLMVLVEAPEERVEAVLTRRPEIRRLVENGWIGLKLA